MRILIAPNAFKGSMSAHQVAQTVEQALLSIAPNNSCKLLPVADGGDGTAKVLSLGLEASKRMVPTYDALGNRIQAPYYVTSDGTAIIELADTAGIRLLKPYQLSPMQSNTYGVGVIMRDALDYGCRKIILGVGGSATLDMGTGLLRALGVRFFDAYSDLDERIYNTEILVACDVNNSLLGSTGAARVFGPQKGASPYQVMLLERNHRYMADLVNSAMGMDISELPYTGAAGGVPALLKVFCKAILRPGANLVMDVLDIDHWLDQCDLVITGEGKIDSQTKFGKAPFVVAQRAHDRGKMVIALTGSYEDFAQNPFDVVFPIIPGPTSLHDAMENASDNLLTVTKEIAKLIKILWKE